MNKDLALQDVAETFTPGAPSHDAAAHAAVPDTLLECLLVVVHAHGGTLSRQAAIDGLPLVDHRLTPSLFRRAAKRAGFTSNVVKKPLEELNPALFPAVLLLDGEEACVLLGWQDDDRTARLIFPELGEAEALLPRDELAARYSGYAILARPEFRFDARTPEVGRVKQRHWFWGTLADNTPLYRDVLLAAFMINLFAIALPLFTMNVYDRVVPNRAIETLWMLAIGLVIVLVADLVLRSMRGYFLDLASSRVDVRLSAYIMERVLGLRLENRPLSAGSFAANLRSFETIRDFITSATVTAFIDLPFALIFLVVIGWIAWPLILPIVFGILLVVAYALTVHSKMHELSETTYRAGAMRNATLVESLVGLEAIKALGAESVMQRKWESSAAFLSRVGVAAAAAVVVDHQRRNVGSAVRERDGRGGRRVPDFRRQADAGRTDRLHHAGFAGDGADRPDCRPAHPVPQRGDRAEVAGRYPAAAGRAAGRFEFRHPPAFHRRHRIQGRRLQLPRPGPCRAAQRLAENPRRRACGDSRPRRLRQDHAGKTHSRPVPAHLGRGAGGWRRSAPARSGRAAPQHRLCAAGRDAVLRQPARQPDHFRPRLPTMPPCCAPRRSAACSSSSTATREAST